MRWFYAPCRSVLVPSESTRDLLVSRGYRADQLGIWSRGVDTTCFTPAAASAELRRSWNADGRLAIVYAGPATSLLKRRHQVAPCWSPTKVDHANNCVTAKRAGSAPPAM
jgi:hypothetical protein